MFDLQSYGLALAVMTVIALVTWGVSVAKRDVSIVDSVWAIFFLPVRWFTLATFRRPAHALR
jgi:steroid 5-alpha reductase family enzyme